MDDFERQIREIQNLPEARFSIVKPQGLDAINLLGEEGYKRLTAIDERMAKYIRQFELRQRHYGFNPENS